MKNKELPTKLLPFIWHFLKKYRVSFILYLVLFISIIDLGSFFLQPYLLKVFFDKVNTKTITVFNGLFLILGISVSDISFLGNIIVDNFRFNSLTKAIEDIRDTMFKYVMGQSVSFFNNNYSGELVNKINSIIETINDAIDCSVSIVKNLFLLICLIGVLFYFSLILGFAGIVWFVCYIFISYYYLTNKKARQSKLIQENQNKINAFVNDDFMNIQNIKAFPNEKVERNILSTMLRKKFKHIKLEIKYTQISDFLFFILNFLMTSLIIIVGSYQLKHSIIEIGSFIFLINIVRMFMIFAREICWFGDAFKNIIIMNDSLELITNDIEIMDKKDAKALKIADGRIIFKNLSFEYKNKLEQQIQ